MDTADYKEALGVRLRALRGNEPLAKLRKRTKLSVSLLSDLEHGRGNPTLETLITLARAFGLSLEELLPPLGILVTRVHESPVAIRRIARRLPGIARLKPQERTKALKALNSVLDAVNVPAPDQE